MVEGSGVRWLIGGPARNGKTTLVHSLGRTGALADLPVEALFTMYLDQHFDDSSVALTNYLERPRWTDSKRTQSGRPVDTFVASLADVVAAAAREGARPLEAIAAALDLMAKEKGRAGWVACDLLPETRWRELRREIEGLRLLVVLRDPRASCCASQYWRTYPRRAEQPGVLRWAAFQWRLSAQTAFDLAERFPGQVCVALFDDLIARNERTLREIASRLSTDERRLADTLPTTPWFTHRDGGFTTPDGSIKPLLTSAEIALVEAMAGPWMTRLGFSDTARTTPAVARMLLVLARRFPEAARILAFHVYQPKMAAMSLLSRIKETAKRLFRWQR